MNRAAGFENRGDSRRHLQVLIAVILLVGLVSVVSGQLPQFPPRPLQLPPPALDLVLAYVTVTAEKNNTPPRLSARDFRIFEDNKEQKIAYFLLQDQPATVGILWAAGAGFQDVDWDVRECPRVFMRNFVPGSEYFLLQGDRVTTPFTTDLTKIPVNFAWSGGSTDNVFIGLDVLKEAANPRRMLLMVGDAAGGGQLHPHYVERVAIRVAAGASATQIHSVIFSAGAVGGEVDHPAAIFLSEVVDLTGGSYNLFPPASTNCANLARELRVQYLIGYRPTNTAKDGKWRQLRVEVDSPENGPKLKARVKRGYYAAKEPR
jgi:Ca-activated chloride channel family protein